MDRRLPRAATFSLRAARLLRDRAGDFDVVHDNQALGYGLLDIERAGPAAGHDASTTRSPSTAASTSRPRRRWRKRLTPAPLVRLPADAGQGRPAGCGTILTAVGVLARATSSRDFGVDPARIAGRSRSASTTVFRPPTAPRVPGPDRRDGQRRRPDEGHRHAARGVRQAAHRARRRAAPGHAGPTPGGRTEQLVDRARHRRPRRASCTASATPSWSSVMGSAEVACVPRSTRASRCRPPS